MPKKESKKELLSVIVNCYNEEETIEIFYEKIMSIIKKLPLDYELIFIDDCSKDNTLSIIKNLNKIDSNVKYISTSRNFGKESGLYAGLEKAKGDYIVSIDVDLQDPPELLTDMYNAIKNEGYDCIATRSVTRNGYSILRKIFTATYYKILKKLSSLEMREGIRDFRMITKRVKDVILSMKEYNRYSRYLYAYAGFKTKWIEFPNQERVAGKTKWSFKRLFCVAVDAFLSSSVKPLYIPVFIGLISFIASIILSIVLIINSCCNNFSHLLLLYLIITLLFSMLSFMIGIGCIYISRIYSEVLNRPIYITRETEESEEK